MWTMKIDVKKLNEIFGYVFLGVGSVKILLLVLAFLKFGTDVALIVKGGSATSGDYNTFSAILGFVEIILAIASIVMIILNAKRQTGAIVSYSLGIGALVLEFLIPSSLSILFVFVEVGMYLKAGNNLLKKDKDCFFGSSEKYM